jgi:hypothetical protein
MKAFARDPTVSKVNVSSRKVIIICFSQLDMFQPLINIAVTEVEDSFLYIKEQAGARK